MPPELDALVLACLAKDPAARPASAAEVSRLLGAVPLADAWTQERARTWWLANSPAATERPQLQEDPEPKLLHAV